MTVPLWQPLHPQAARQAPGGVVVLVALDGGRAGAPGGPEPSPAPEPAHWRWRCEHDTGESCGRTIGECAVSSTPCCPRCDTLPGRCVCSTCATCGEPVPPGWQEDEHGPGLCYDLEPLDNDTGDDDGDE